ncbi:hypothetical protein RFF05_09825 [Bengtsoniella intestinalis]|uniref:CIS tube protein n=1 Tax=Bengtsoniella intestinalis TaxID=3073143 RepID=UPI00391F8DB2
MSIANSANFSSFLRKSSATAYLILYDVNDKKSYHNLAFNPNELKIKAQHKPESRTYFNTGSQGTSSQNSHVNAYVDFSVKLYLDNLDNLPRSDYSRMDELQASVDTAEGIYIAATTTQKVRERKLYDQVNGLVQSLNSASTRKVEFCWNKFSFLGLVTGVQVEYTMFTFSGNPIRATIDLTLRQLHDDIAKKPYITQYNAWLSEEMAGEAVSNDILTP